MRGPERLAILANPCTPMPRDAIFSDAVAACLEPAPARCLPVGRSSLLAAQGAIDPERRAARGRARARGRAADGHRPAGPLPRHGARRRARLAAARPVLPLRRPRLAPARHRGDPDGLLYLDFAATALDQAVRLSVDSGLVLPGHHRGRPRAGRGGEAGLESRTRYVRPQPGAPPMPAFIVELGANLLTSCPAGGVLLTGSDLEAVSVWYGSLQDRAPLDILPDPPRSLRHRFRLSPAHGAPRWAWTPRCRSSARWPRRRASRTLCLSPSTDLAAAPGAHVGAVPPGARQPRRRRRAGRAQRRGAAQGQPPGRVRRGCGTFAASTRPPPATTSSSAAACFSSSGTPRRAACRP